MSDQRQAVEPMANGVDLGQVLRDAGLLDAAASVEKMQRELADRGPRRHDPITLALSPVDFALAAAERQLLDLGIPIDVLVRFAMQHAASILALVEPPAVRAEMLKQHVSNFPTMVRNALLAQRTTGGGIIVPSRS